MRRRQVIARVIPVRGCCSISFVLYNMLEIFIKVYFKGVDKLYGARIWWRK